MTSVPRVAQKTAVSTALTYGICLMAMACDVSAPDPVAPIDISLADNSAAIAGVGARGGSQASGRADIHATVMQGVRDETYSFIAVPDGPAPSAKGHVELHFLRFTDQVVVVRADVTCLAVVGNQAWIGSRVSRLTVDGEEDPSRVGHPMVFRVQDMGEGDAVNDFASLGFFPPAGGDLTHCNTRPAFPILRESANGTIQVKSD